MNKDIEWVILHKTTSNFEAEVMKGNLETQGIPTIVLNKKDSSYNSFGYLEVHVDVTRIEEARVIINDENSKSK